MSVVLSARYVIQRTGPFFLLFAVISKLQCYLLCAKLSSVQMLPPHIKIMRGLVPDSMIRPLLIADELAQSLIKMPVNSEWDLNPHLQVAQTCREVAHKIAEESEGIACTTEDVMLYWLTMAVTEGMFLEPLAFERIEKRKQYDEQNYKIEGNEQPSAVK